MPVALTISTAFTLRTDMALFNLSQNDSRTEYHLFIMNDIIVRIKIQERSSNLMQLRVDFNETMLYNQDVALNDTNYYVYKE